MIVFVNNIKNFYIEHKRGLLLFAIGFLAVCVGIYFAFIKNKPQKQAEITKNDIVINPSDIKQDTFVTDNQAPDTSSDSQNMESNGENYVSKHFKMKSIAVGGDALIAVQSSNEKLQISDVRSEATIPKKGESAKLLVTWKTNKMARSQVQYSKGALETGTKVNEPGYGFSHAVILSRMDQAVRYSFVINATDQWGSKASSELHSVYMAENPKSVFDIIADEFRSIFRWAM